ncbi:uncharacterized protein BKCO1_1100053 [Diplodia corticola]|uniref:Uncharacterized protein n=1 Tax=Diplodia corticola TaxID=236234 RepID=A0A1J9RV20_9PEZI|nr:uncharacterized protein BKCO1_1100053 [Diplodia corticola]OJD36435.1 hypothetical protein BKCO1_1100053 [Diplodia corticola]
MTTSPRAMEPTDLEKGGELCPLLAPTPEPAAFHSFPHPTDDNNNTDDLVDAANEATTASLLTTIATSTTILCSALLTSLYRHPLWLQRLLDLSRMPCSHPQHQPSHFITEIPRPLFLLACAAFVASASALYFHRRARGDAHQDALLAAGVLMGVTAGLGLGFGVEDVVRVAGVWAVGGALVASAVGHEVLALVIAGEEEDVSDMDEMVGRRGSVMSAVAGEFGGVWRERGGRS